MISASTSTSFPSTFLTHVCVNIFFGLVSPLGPSKSRFTGTTTTSTLLRKTNVMPIGTVFCRLLDDRYIRLTALVAVLLCCTQLQSRDPPPAFVHVRIRQFSAVIGSLFL